MQHNKNYKNQIKEYVKTFGGIVTSKYCREHNIPTIYLNRLVEEGFCSMRKGVFILLKTEIMMNSISFI